MRNAERVNLIYKIVGAIFFSGCLLLLPVISFAQNGEDCGDADPVDSNCPLDTWVLVLAVIALVFAVVHLYRKQKKQNQAALKIKA